MKHLVMAAIFAILTLSLGANAAPQKSLNRDDLMAELTGKDVTRMNDASLYAEIVGAYQAQDQLTLQTRLQTLLKRFPQSEYADNALYLAGKSAMEHRNYAGALKYFSKVNELYPNGNKVVSAQFAKAMAYRKMNLDPQAKEVLLSLKKRFPGSPEAFRADGEIKQLR